MPQRQGEATSGRAESSNARSGGPGRTLAFPPSFDQLGEALSTAFATIDDAVFVIGSEPRTIVACNAVVERMFGYAVSEVIGRDTSFLHVDRESFEAFGRMSGAELEQSGSFRRRYVMRRKDGSTFQTLHTVTLLEPDYGVSGGAVSIVRDVSDLSRAADALRESEERFIRAQKLSAVGRLAAAIAHDLNNFLLVIWGHADRLRQEALSPDQEHSVRAMYDAAESASSLARRLLSLHGRPALERHVVDPNAQIVRLSRLLRSVLGEGVLLETRLDPEVGRVSLGATQLEQVLLNLVMNARDATPGVGRFEVETRNALLSEQAAERLGLAPGRYVVLAVRDTGIGMSDETRERAFEPFFTTKEEGRGAGVGLAAVRMIVEQNRGSITLESEAGVGTALEIHLPRVADAPEAVEGSGAEARGWETVLVVEDDDAVRELIEGMLSSHGFRVMGARTADEAARIAGAHDGGIHALVTDVALPDESGTAFAARLRRDFQDLRILFVSGHPPRRVSPEELEGPGVGFLAKPFTREALVGRLRRLLDERS